MATVLDRDNKQDMNKTVASYWPYIEYAAKRYVGWNNAEFDDLVQEGAIATWLFLRDGGFWPFCPQVVWHRAMSNYAQSLRTGGWRLEQEG